MQSVGHASVLCRHTKGRVLAFCQLLNFLTRGLRGKHFGRGGAAHVRVFHFTEGKACVWVGYVFVYVLVWVLGWADFRRGVEDMLLIMISWPRGRSPVQFCVRVCFYFVSPSVGVHRVQAHVDRKHKCL